MHFNEVFEYILKFAHHQHFLFTDVSVVTESALKESSILWLTKTHYDDGNLHVRVCIKIIKCVNCSWLKTLSFLSYQWLKKSFTRASNMKGFILLIRRKKLTTLRSCSTRNLMKRVTANFNSNCPKQKKILYFYSA